VLDYLSLEEEMDVIARTTTTHVSEAEPVTNAEEILGFQELVRMVPVADSVCQYALELIRATRNSSPEAPDFVKQYVNFGASVRGAQFLILAAKARALMNRRYHVSVQDIQTLLTPVLRHRILLNFRAESERIDSDNILARLIEWKPAPSAG
jgi:MoxR-like ATPase